MSNYLTETQILNKLGISDFRHMSKDKIIAFASMIQEMDPDVAKAAIQQFPNFSKMVIDAIEEQKTVMTSIADNNKIVTEKCLEMLDNIGNSIGNCLERNEISFEEKKYYIDTLMEIAKLEADVEQRNAENNVQTQILVTIATIILGAFATSILGGNIRFKTA